MDIAQDARNGLRQSMPGHDYLMARAKCSRATLNRRIKALIDAKLLMVVRRSAPGVRAVYEIPPLSATRLSVSETRSCLNGSETRSGAVRSPPGPSAHADVSQKRPERVSALVRHTPKLPTEKTSSLSTNGASTRLLVR